MVKITVGVPGLAAVEADASEVLSRLGDLTKPVAIVKRDAGGLAFDTGHQTTPDSPVIVWSLHCAAHQLWYLDRREKGTVSIRSARTGLVLGASRSMVDGSAVTMQEWSSKPWQRWRIVQCDEPRTFSILSVVTEHGSKSMDVPNEAQHLTPVQIYGSWNGGQQKFMLLRPQE